MIVTHNLGVATVLSHWSGSYNVQAGDEIMESGTRESDPSSQTGAHELVAAVPGRCAC